MLNKCIFNFVIITCIIIGSGYNAASLIYDCSNACIACNNNTSCVQCQNRYYLTSTGSCEPCNFPCLLCSNSINCTACYSGYYHTEQDTCAACPNNCQSCTAAGCNTNGCKSGYSLIGDTCLPCAPNCNYCTINGTCASNGCASRYTYNATTQLCDACGNYCYGCSVGGKCDPPCYNGWAVVYNASTQLCDACPPNCESCVSSTICNPTGCKYGFAYDELTRQCFACISRCKVCLANNTCEPQGCESGYTFNTLTQTCIVCTPNCKHCVADYTCLPLECNDGFVFNATFQTCDACSSHCFKCKTAGTCDIDTCNRGYYYNSSLGLCSACPIGCEYCTSSNSCHFNGCCANLYNAYSWILCSYGYEYSGYVYDITKKICARCAANCQWCLESDTCLPNYCFGGYTYEPTSRKCRLCANNCNRCDSPATCVAPNGCADSFSYVYGNELAPCVACTPGKTCITSPCGIGFTYDPLNQTCIACPPNCRYCSSNNTCVANACNPNFYNETTKTCQAITCSPGCYVFGCSRPGTCFKNSCYNHYTYNETTERCDECAPYCDFCTTANTCKFDRCYGGFAYNQTTQSCDACIARCSSCKFPNTCNVDGCQNGFMYDVANNTCRACAPNCNFCIYPGTCTQQGCAYGYILERVNKTCIVNLPCNYNPQQCYFHGNCTNIPTDPFFKCVCDYKYTGSRCLDVVSPCVYNSLQCYNHGICTAITYSPYFQCTCNYGYRGAQCEKSFKSHLYPYGFSVNDNALYGSDDGSSVKLLFNPGFLFFGRILSSAYINVNGFVSFSINYLSYRPMPFPHDNEENADLLGVFWADSDTSDINCDCTPGCYTCGNNVVYYRNYTFNSGQPSSDPLEEQIYNMTKEDGQYITGFQNTDFVLIITWSQMKPFPSYYNKYSSETNTFQAVLATDLLSMKSFVSYRYETIAWNAVRPAIMGYQGIKSGENVYYNNKEDAYQLTNKVGTLSGDAGVWRFDTSGIFLPNEQNSCSEWMPKQKKPEVEVIINTVKLLPPCPCTGFQALFSPSHCWLQDTNCFVTARNINNISAAMKCCYDRNVWMWSYHWSQWSWMWSWVWLGNLIVHPVYEAGGYYPKHPHDDQLVEDHQDMQKKFCCLYSTHCRRFYEIRPLKTCDGFIPSRISTTYGDPHIITFDGLSYDYNGIGEYWLVKSNALYVQGRAVQARDTNNRPAQASVFGAYAVQTPLGPNQNKSDCVLLQTSDFSKLELYVRPTSSNAVIVNLTNWINNQTDYSLPPNVTSSDTIGVYNGFVLRRLNAGKGIVVTVNGGTSLIFRLDAGQLTITSTPGPKLFQNSLGLLGTYDNNQTNDFTLPDGKILSTDSEPDVVYSVFGESWRIKSSESIMYYGSSSYSTYQNSSFVPIFRTSFSSPAAEQEAQKTCGANSACLFDFAATGNKNLAISTLASSTASNETNNLFQNSQPTIFGLNILRVTLNKLFTTIYTTNNSDGSAVTMSTSGMPPEATFNQLTGLFSWTPMAMSPVVNLSINAVSGNGVPALSIAVAIFMCDGCNNHGSCDFETTSPAYNYSYRFQLVPCTCFTGYLGDSCDKVYDRCSDRPCGDNATCVSLLPGQVNAYGLAFNCTKCSPGQTLNFGKCVNANVSEINIINSQSACVSMPCRNFGMCQGTNSSYNCTCTPGTVGVHCQTVIDNCQSTPCQQNGTCINAINSFTCICVAGYVGAMCQKIFDNCESSPCRNGAICNNDINRVTCTCATGYTGQYCQTIIDYCNSTSCQNGGTCIPRLNGVSCLCGPLFNGTTCGTALPTCRETKCYNQGTCKADRNGLFLQCNCSPIFTGVYCETALPTCSNTKCRNQATCSSDVNGLFLRCTCAPGFTGVYCERAINNCGQNPCLNGAGCDISNSQYYCYCVPGYTGQYCQRVIDNCLSNPCNYDGTCSNGINTYTCACAPGYYGDNCQNLTDNCVSSPCLNKGTCKNAPNAYKCQCEKGYVGDNCASIFDNCQSLPCKNGANCNNALNSYSCTCAAGFTGTNCISMINYCESTPCLNGATCLAGPNKYTCSCQIGFIGTFCQTATSNCLSNPCLNGAACVASIGQTRCSCVSGYTGTNCQSVINNCLSVPCQNGATCVNAINSFTCNCPSDYIGILCQQLIDPCKSSPCQNGGSCITQPAGYTCVCPNGRTGSNCQSAYSFDQAISLEVTVSSFNWNDDLTDPMTAIFYNYQALFVAEMSKAFARGIGRKQFKQCSIKRFRRGSVIALAVLSFTVSSSDSVNQLSFPSDVRSQLQTYLSSSNTLSINPDTSRINVLQSSDNDPCLSAFCQQVCVTSVQGSAQCSCFSGYALLSDQTNCQSTNTQNSNTVSLVVGLVFGGLALVALWVIAIIACKKLGRKEPSIGKLRKSGQNFPLNYDKSWLTRSSALSSQIPNAWLPYGRYGYGNYNYWWSNPYLQRPYGSWYSSETPKYYRM